MAGSELCVSLLVMAGTVLGTACCRQLCRRSAARSAQGFLLEASGVFQICACTHELLQLAGLLPAPHVALALTYLCTALHGWTLPDSVNNPASSFHLLFRGRTRLRTWALQLCAQLTGAVLASGYIRLVWLLGMTAAHSRALGQSCGNPMQTTLVQAFVLELLFSFLFHLTLLQLEAMSHETKVHLVALLVTTLVYAGGNLTGAIFNPALALSLHTRCFMDKFWNYVLVYWIAPCLGSALVVVLWDDVLPLIRVRA